MAWDVYSNVDSDKGSFVESVSRSAWSKSVGAGTLAGKPVAGTGWGSVSNHEQKGGYTSAAGIPIPGWMAGQPGVHTGALPVAGGIVGRLPAILKALGIVGAAGGVADVMSPNWGMFRGNGGGTRPQSSPPGTSPYGIPFVGPGLKEPHADFVLKEWHIRVDSKDGDFDLQYYLTQNMRGTKRIWMYNQRTKGWKSWPMPRLAVIGKNMPSHKMLTRLRRNLKRQTSDAKLILKLTSPTSLRAPKRRWYGRRKR